MILSGQGSGSQEDTSFDKDDSEEEDVEILLKVLQERGEIVFSHNWEGGAGGERTLRRRSRWTSTTGTGFRKLEPSGESGRAADSWRGELNTPVYRRATNHGHFGRPGCHRNANASQMSPGRTRNA
jgi:hypothetical protein